MGTIYEAAKYQGKWAVYDKVSRTFSHIGKGKKFCIAKAKELTEELLEIWKDPIFNV